MSQVSALVDVLTSIRDLDRIEYGRKLFERLGHGDSLFISEPQLDEFLLKTVRHYFGTSIHADILLMAFGLLPGYEHSVLQIGNRRVKFLRESNWLKVNKKSKIKDYDSASKKEQDDARESLRNTEKYWMKKLAEKLMGEIVRTDKDGIAKYIKLLDEHMEEVRDSSGQLIDYIPKKVTIAPSTKDDASDEGSNPEETNKHSTFEEDLSQDEPPADDDTPEENELPADDDTPEENEEGHDPLPKNTSTANSGGQNNYSGEKPRGENNHSKKKSKRSIHIGKITIGPLMSFNKSFNKNTQVNAKPSWTKISGICVLIVIVTLLLLWYFLLFAPPVKEIFVSKDEIILVPGEIRVIDVAVLPRRAATASLNYVSSDPSIATVSSKGVVTAQDNGQSGMCQTIEITIQADSGATAKKEVTVIVPSNVDDPTISGEQDFIVEQKIRLVGTLEWLNYVDAKVGDEVEIQFEYRNISEVTQFDVAVRDILPTNLAYIYGTTKIYAGKWPDGLTLDQDTLIEDGIGIGSYDPGANAFIRFTAQVVDTNLVDGVTGLVNWTQASVDGVTLQDYATLRVTKE